MKLYSLQEAVEWLEENLHIKTSYDSLYKKVVRDKRFEKRKIKNKDQWAVTEEEMRSFQWGKSSPHPINFEIVTIRSAEDIEMLKGKYGEIVDGETFLRLLAEKFEHTWTVGSLKLRRQRKTVWVVGVSEGGHYWYPTVQLGMMYWLPNKKTYKLNAKAVEQYIGECT